MMAIVPPLSGVLLGYPFWKRSQPILGNLAGSVVIFGSALVLILRESVELDRLTRQCIDAGYYCIPPPPGYSSYAIYRLLALFEVVALFTLSLPSREKVRSWAEDRA